MGNTSKIRTSANNSSRSWGGISVKKHEQLTAVHEYQKGINLFTIIDPMGLDYYTWLQQVIAKYALQSSDDYWLQKLQMADKQDEDIIFNKNIALKLLEEEPNDSPEINEAIEELHLNIVLEIGSVQKQFAYLESSNKNNFLLKAQLQKTIAEHFTIPLETIQNLFPTTETLENQFFTKHQHSKDDFLVDLDKKMKSLALDLFANKQESKIELSVKQLLKLLQESGYQCFEGELLYYLQEYKKVASVKKSAFNIKKPFDFHQNITYYVLETNLWFSDTQSARILNLKAKEDMLCQG